MKKLIIILAATLFTPGVLAETTGTEAYARAANTFGLKSLQYVFKSNPAANTVYSPISAHMALSMLLNGADQKSADEISRTLGVSLDSLAATDEQVQKLMADLNSRPEGELKLVLANGMWIKPGLTVKPAYSAAMNKYFQAEVAPLNSPEQVNNWASMKTNGLIPKVIDNLSDIELLLANATYFKGTWTTQFEKAREGQFFPLGMSTAQKAQMMSVTASVKYVSADNMEAVELPYGKSRLASLIAVLPQKGSVFAAFRSQVDINWLNSVLEQLAQAPVQRVAVMLPKVDATTSFEMTSALSDMGMPTVFTNSADLNKISAQPLKVSKVKQDALIKIDEKGTEAAAVTSIGVRTLAVEMPAARFIADHPFLYFIRDNKTGVILFAGQIVKP